MFALSTKSPVDSVTVAFRSDPSITHSGFALTYEVTSSASAIATRNIPCPGPPICSNNGACVNGVCLCLSGFVGEDCSNQVVCPRDLTSCGTSCDPVCSEPPANVIVVSVNGDDAQGTGEMMDSSQTGTAPKAVRSLRRAIAMATPGQIILVYPGTYGGSLNCDLFVTKKLTVRGLRGASVTTIDCAHASRGITIAGADSVTLADLALINTLGTNGTAVKIVGSRGCRLERLGIAGATSSGQGGGIYVSQSELTLHDIVVKNCSAISGGGGLFIDSAKLTLSSAVVTSCRAANGAGIYVTGDSVLAGVNAAVIEKNVASAQGGGLFLSDGTITTSRLSVQANRASVGGGLAIETGGVITIALDVKANVATFDGGGIAALHGAVLTSTSTNVRGNQAYRNGGGVFATTNESLVFDAQSTLSNNTAGTLHDLWTVHPPRSVWRAYI